MGFWRRIAHPTPEKLEHDLERFFRQLLGGYVSALHDGELGSRKRGEEALTDVEGNDPVVPPPEKQGGYVDSGKTPSKFGEIGGYHPCGGLDQSGAVRCAVQGLGVCSHLAIGDRSSIVDDKEAQDRTDQETFWNQPKTPFGQAPSCGQGDK